MFELSEVMFDSNPKNLSPYEIAVRNADRTYHFREKLDLAQKWLRSCAICTTTLPPIDLVCDVCWAKLFRFRNRGPDLLQSSYPFPVYSLFTWTEETEALVKPFIYGFKKGRSVSAAKDLALEFMLERQDAGELARNRVLIPPPSNSFDHGDLWTKSLSERCHSPTWPVLRTSGSLTAPNGSEKRVKSQKLLSRTERGDRRYEIREQIAGFWPLENESGRLIFADDVITTGSTAMAAYMALGDPVDFEVWTLVARPRVATH